MLKKTVEKMWNNKMRKENAFVKANWTELNWTERNEVAIQFRRLWTLFLYRFAINFRYFQILLLDKIQMECTHFRGKCNNFSLTTICLRHHILSNLSVEKLEAKLYFYQYHQTLIGIKLDQQKTLGKKRVKERERDIHSSFGRLWGLKLRGNH